MDTSILFAFVPKWKLPPKQCLFLSILWYSQSCNNPHKDLDKFGYKLLPTWTMYRKETQGFFLNFESLHFNTFNFEFHYFGYMYVASKKKGYSKAILPSSTQHYKDSCQSTKTKWSSSQINVVILHGFLLGESCVTNLSYCLAFCNKVNLEVSWPGLFFFNCLLSKNWRNLPNL